MTGYFENKILVNSLWKKGSLKAFLEDTLKENVEYNKKNLWVVDTKNEAESLVWKKEKALKDYGLKNRIFHHYIQESLN